MITKRHMIWSHKDCLKMYKIADEEETIKNWRVKLTAGGKSLAEVKIQRGIFQRDVLSPLLFVIVMMLLNYILRKCTGGINHKSQ